jgi:hypothetical protein
MCDSCATSRPYASRLEAQRVLRRADTLRSSDHKWCSRTAQDLFTLHVAIAANAWPIVAGGRARPEHSPAAVEKASSEGRR